MNWSLLYSAISIMSIDRIEKAGLKIQSLEFKSPGIFTNSLLKNVVTTHIIRDIESAEVPFVKGKTAAEVDNDTPENAALLESLVCPTAGQSGVSESRRHLLHEKVGIWWKLSRLLGKDLELLDSPPPGYPQDDDPKELIRCIDELEDRIKRLLDVLKPDEKMCRHIDDQIAKARRLQKEICDLENVVNADRAELRRLTISE